MSETLKITRQDTVELFEAIGITTAAKWKPVRLAAKLKKIDELVDEDTALEGAVDENLTRVLEALEAGHAIEVVDEDTAPPAKKKAAAKKKAPAKKKAAAKKDAVPEPEPDAPVVDEDADPLAGLKARYESKEIDAKEYAKQRKALMKKKKAAGAPAKDAKAKTTPAKDAPKKKAGGKAKADMTLEEKKEIHTEYVRPREARTRYAVAGEILRREGLGETITAAMVEELDETYGKRNPRESIAALRNAWHAITGYNG